jgi:hypothetical protein
MVAVAIYTRMQKVTVLAQKACGSFDRWEQKEVLDNLILYFAL